MTRFLIEAVRSVLRHFGIVAFKRSTRVYIPEEESFRIAAELCGKKTPVIVDGGAHRGGCVALFRDHVPAASFICFEPDPDLVSQMKETFAGQSNVTVVHAALGESRSTATFNINESRPTNSLLPAVEALSPSDQRLYQTVRQISVDVVSLDDYRKENGVSAIDILKLDLQGYDYRALLGARETLRNVDVVLTEVWYTEVYKGAHLFPDVLSLMRECGFRLHTICGIHYGERDELMWSDAIFTRLPAADTADRAVTGS